jgi:acetate kinase
MAHILALNAGSSSLKFGLYDGGEAPVVDGDLDWAGGDRRQARWRVCRGSQVVFERPTAVADAAEAVKLVLRSLQEAMPEVAARVDAIGHRVVHGGLEFQHSVRIDSRVKTALERLGPLAPLHNPPALRVIQATEELLSGVPQVAVFDTAFYASLPPRAYVYPLPYCWHEEWGIRRFGFHGLSHAYCAVRTVALFGGRHSARRIVSCHLGGGCSATAVLDGKAIATTMGFSPLEGLMMGTRCGSVDPGVLLYLQRERGLSVEELDRVLNRESGLQGVSGRSPDLARIEAGAREGDERCQLAFEMFADRVRSSVGALAATLGGIDALVFTDRIGEHSAALRAAVCEGLGFMGLELDAAGNASAAADCDIARETSRARVLVLRTREELMVAREVATVVAGG